MKSKPSKNDQRCTQCERCGARERQRKVGGVLMSNISQALRICGQCCAKEVGL